MAAPGIAALARLPSAAPWEGLCSATIDRALASVLGSWAPLLGGAPSGEFARYGASGVGLVPLCAPALGAMPGRERACAFPEWAAEALLVAPAVCRRDADPALPALANKTDAFVDNRALRLAPNSLLYGRCKGYEVANPRQRHPGCSSLAAAAPRGGACGGDDDNASVSSV